VYVPAAGSEAFFKTNISTALLLSEDLASRSSRRVRAVPLYLTARTLGGTDIGARLSYVETPTKRARVVPLPIVCDQEIVLAEPVPSKLHPCAALSKVIVELLLLRLRGVGALAVKSAELLLVSWLPDDFLITAVVFDPAGAGDVSEQVGVAPVSP
jgi:hypothetical protein